MVVPEIATREIVSILCRREAETTILNDLNAVKGEVHLSAISDKSLVVELSILQPSSGHHI
jgi:hypothetical protein